MAKSTGFAKIRSIVEKQDMKREELIRISSGFIKKTKVIIFSLHRGESREAGALVRKLEGDFKRIKKLISKHPALYYSGIYKIIVQEYVEALAYYHFVVSGKLLGLPGLGVSPEHYLLGLCDLTGELVRMAINSTIKKDYRTAMRIKDFVSGLFGEFLKINLRSHELRKKIDEAKHSLKKLEDLAVSISLKE